jgi:hypothetical protein
MFYWAQISSSNPYEIFFYRPNPELKKTGGYHLRAKEVVEMIRTSAVHFGLDPKRFVGKSMRSSAAKHLNAQGLNIEACKSVTGHASTSSFNIYVRPTVKDCGVLDLSVTNELTTQDIKRAMLSSRY